MSTPTAADWKTDALGVWTEPTEFAVEKARTIAYAEATNDENPRHLSGELAPPVFAIVPAFQTMVQPILGVVPQELMMRGVHGQQDFRFHRPIRPGDVLRTTAAVVGVHGKSTGVAVLGHARTTTADDEPVVDQLMSYFVRGGRYDGSVGEPLPEHAFDEGLRAGTPIAAVEHAYDADQTRRYSEASGDPMPIHLDDDFARSMGLPGIIVHGLCTMAFAGRAVIGATCPEDPARLRRLAVRFSQIVQPSETVTHTLYDAGISDGRRTVAFETTSSAGGTALKDGVAEIAE